MFVNLVVKFSVIETVPVGHLDVSSFTIKVPVGNTVSDHVTLKVGLEDGIIISVVNVVLIDLIRDVRNVDTGIGLTRNIQLVLLVLSESLVPSQDSGQVIGGRVLISENTLISVVASRVTNTSW